MVSTDLRNELEELCSDNGLNIDFNFNYPIRITIGKALQVKLFSDPPEEAYLVFKFPIDSIDFEFVGDFKLDDKLFSKLLGKAKKLHYIYLQEKYAQQENRFKNCVKQMWTTINGDVVALVKKGYRG